jgi:anti-sigma B factor antagonist
MVEVAGEVDVLTAPVLLETARNQLAAGCHTLVLDLASVSFCSARGIGALVELRHLAEQYEAVVRLVHPSEQVLRIADLTHTREVIEGGAPRDPSWLDPARSARSTAVAAGGSVGPGSSGDRVEGEPAPPARDPAHRDTPRRTSTAGGR